MTSATITTTRRQFLAGATATTVASAAFPVPATEVLTPELFGARGDGRTNDTAAFKALSDHVNARGGGTIVLRPVTYIVGTQVATGGTHTAVYSFAPADIIRLSHCTNPIVLHGNGARLRCAPGLRFGAFDPLTGRPAPDSLPERAFWKHRATPYQAMILVTRCSGPVEITEIELDGNLQELQAGGRYNPTVGWNAPADGILFIDNSGGARLSRIHSHHHARDGIQFNDSTKRTTSTIMSDARCDFNGRQACSITGGRNYTFERCRFLNTSKAGFRSSPASGVDIEAEAKTIRNVTFSQCEFANNWGFGIVAGTGDSEGLSFDQCKIIGTTNWAAWLHKPRMRFTGCLIVGSMINAFGDSDPARATQFHDCRFTDDPSLSPTGRVYLAKPKPAIAVLPTDPPMHCQNVLFNRCRFQLVAKGLLPSSGNVVRYADCEMSQHSPAVSRPRGTYTGTTTISGNADLSGSSIRGIVILNGRRIPKTN